jgi:hypothetical protein
MFAVGVDSGRVRETLEALGVALAKHTSPVVAPPIATHSEIATIIATLGSVADAARSWVPKVQSVGARRHGATQVTYLLNGLSEAWNRHVEDELGDRGLKVVASLLQRPVPDFLSLLRRHRDENSHSDVLAFFCDPSCAPSIAQDLLIEMTSGFVNSPHLHEAIVAGCRLGMIAVQREAELIVDKRRGFIDILVKSDRFAIAIENKVGTSEHSNQTELYAEWLKKHFATFSGIFLSPTGKSAVSPAFASLSYFRLVKLLVTIAADGMTDAEATVLSSYLKTLQASVLQTEFSAIRRRTL